jgi:hypothetical protein
VLKHRPNREAAVLTIRRINGDPEPAGNNPSPAKKPKRRQFWSKNSKNGGKRPFPSIEMTVLNTKDMILCIKDDVLNTADDALCIKDHVLNTADDALCIKDHVLNTTDDVLCIKKAVLNTTESFLGIGKSFRKIGKQGRKPMKIAIKSLFFPDGIKSTSPMRGNLGLDDQICKSIKFYRIIPIDNRATWKVAKRSPRIRLDSWTNLMVINTNVAAHTTASQLEASSQLLSQSLARLPASPARSNPGLRDGRPLGFGNNLTDNHRTVLIQKGYKDATNFYIQRQTVCFHHEQEHQFHQKNLGKYMAPALLLQFSLQNVLLQALNLEGHLFQKHRI